MEETTQLEILTEEQKNKIEHSGDPHEYLNGKHIKDWAGKIRLTIESMPEEDLVLVFSHFSMLTDDVKTQLRNRSRSNGTGN